MWIAWVFARVDCIVVASCVGRVWLLSLVLSGCVVMQLCPRAVHLVLALLPFAPGLTEACLPACLPSRLPQICPEGFHAPLDHTITRWKQVGGVGEGGGAAIEEQRRWNRCAGAPQPALHGDGIISDGRPLPLRMRRTPSRLAHTRMYRPMARKRTTTGWATRVRTTAI